MAEQGEFRNNIFGLGGEGEGNAKLFEDRYELYVNDQYVGKKTLLNMNDDLKDVDDFLKSQGFSNFKSELDGDHYKINTSGEDSDEILNALSVYLNNR